MRRHVAGRAEKGRVTEGQQSHVADQQVERAREQGEAERLHEEDRVDEEWQNREHHHHDHEGHRLVPQRPHGHLRRCGALDLRLDRAHQEARPKSPVGRIRSTIAMTTKITVLEASG
jgi:hypothetical protein